MPPRAEISNLPQSIPVGSDVTIYIGGVGDQFPQSVVPHLLDSSGNPLHMFVQQITPQTTAPSVLGASEVAGGTSVKLTAPLALDDGWLTFALSASRYEGAIVYCTGTLADGTPFDTRAF